MKCKWNQGGVCQYDRHKGIECYAEYEEDCPAWETAEYAPILTIKEAAREMNMSRQALWKYYLKTDRLKTHKSGNITFIKREELEEFKVWYHEQQKINKSSNKTIDKFCHK